LKEDQIKIKKIRLEEIDAFAQNAPRLAPYQKTVPISRRRALSQLNNPYGRPDDVALLVALHGDQCVGYQGLLPGLFWHQNALKRVHWSTAFFVSPDYRGAGVAGRLLEEIKALNIDFPVTRMTESARQAYLKAGFQELGHLTYYQLRMEKIRKLQAILQEAEKLTETGSEPKETTNLTSAGHWHESPLYQSSKAIFYRRLLGGLIGQQDAIEHRKVAQIDTRAQRIIARQSKDPRFFRGLEALNWMLNYRWLISAASEKVEPEPYYFSLVSKRFEYIALEIYSPKNSAFKGFLILSVVVKKGRTWVKILDFGFKEPADGNLAAYFALIWSNKYSADRLEFPARLLEYFEGNSLLQPLIKRQERVYLFYPRSQGSAFEDCVGKIRFDYCDADTAFT
jgi:GNAT superfamily N-acetyltransferase